MATNCKTAKFWKCALQVNPAGYIKYRGTDHELSEEEYNQKLLEVARENDIKVIGIADHGNVDGVDAIRTLMNENGIIVFPGFEICTTEKIHFVCLFPETTTKDKLNRYLGTLKLADPIDDTYPSDLSGNDLIKTVEDLNGFAYAAHVTQDSGILKQRSHHIWQNPLLKAAQIPGELVDLRSSDESEDAKKYKIENNAYYRVLINQELQYKREHPIAIINAKDVAKPEDLKNPKASCLIKMTEPNFESFKLAFQDARSRVRLNSDASSTYYSRIESIQITGGYLDSLDVCLSSHLNTVIGGRGTGKSTLLECIRFALEHQPIGVEAKKQHEAIIKENLGKSKGTVELKIRSSVMNGKTYTVSRRFGQSATIQDDEGEISRFTTQDILPTIEIFGQNEIYEIARSSNGQRKLLNRFLEISTDEIEQKIQEALQKLAENRERLTDAQSDIATIEDEVAKLPKLEERLKQFNSLGLAEKLEIIPLLEKEKGMQKRITEEEVASLNRAFATIKDNLPDTVFLSDSAIDGLPHAGHLRKIREGLNRWKGNAEELLRKWEESSLKIKDEIIGTSHELTTLIQTEETSLEKVFRDLPALEGKSGSEVGVAYQNLLKEIEKTKPRASQLETKGKVVEELTNNRKMILAELSSLKSERTAAFDRILKKLNKRLKGKIRLKVTPESNKSRVVDFLLGCGLEGVGEKRLNWIKESDSFSTIRLAELIRLGSGALKKADWGITATVADALAKMKVEQILELEEIELSDTISIELNIAHDEKENYKPMESLSTGQQSTAILHLLLLDNRDPLIMDQPEDNLDNAFIAERIVTELRDAKLERQFLFATHNANIPVFGDAEWIGVFESVEGQGQIAPELQGAIDVPEIRSLAADILEGGKEAFNQRKAKYNF